MNLNTNLWKEFIVCDVFSCNTTSALDINDAIDGNMPYITRSALNNGVTDYYGNSEKMVKGNCITIGAEGTLAFYQPNDFIPGVKIYTIRHKNLNPINAMFLLTLLNKCAYLYSYGRARILEKLKQEIIKLPIDSNGNIDWQFMENYIKSLNQKTINVKNEGVKITYSWND